MEFGEDPSKAPTGRRSEGPWHLQGITVSTLKYSVSSEPGVEAELMPLSRFTRTSSTCGAQISGVIQPTRT